MGGGEMCRGQEQPLGETEEEPFRRREAKEHVGAKVGLVDILPSVKPLRALKSPETFLLVNQTSINDPQSNILIGENGRDY
jgi:hypothetical protein